MIASVKITEKSFGATQLYKNLNFSIQKGEKLAIIGRNGVGKSTLFNIMDGKDGDFVGDLIYKKGIKIATTRQEHHDVDDLTAVAYILQELPEYSRLKHIIETYPAHMGDNEAKITKFTEALERFGELGFYHVEDEVRTTLADYQIGDKADMPLKTLSGGQRRFVELVKLTHARADLLLIDEPTNHMDYIAKERFIKWFKNAPQAVVVISHDRDILQTVDQIIELTDGLSLKFVGNYDAYLRQNATTTVSQLNDYETALRTIENLNKQIQSVRAKKASTSKTPNPFIPLERRLVKERDELKVNLQKPNFWVDQESLAGMQDKVSERYHKYKAKNISLNTKSILASKANYLVSALDLSLGYSEPLFTDVNFTISPGDRLEIRGRNGAGKSTIINAIMEFAAGNIPETLKAGEIKVDKKCKIGRYEQEISGKLLDLNLVQAIEQIYRDFGLSITDQEIMRLMSNYLFDPQLDKEKEVSKLSGGQKARLQLIRLFANNPDLLILDEPTNHLDLPSIEELENALLKFGGAILYVSHDSYFTKKLAGQVVKIGR
ncbi:MAG TPA: ABC-F family ATP-binding cassette domain-containing protein [Candidatus Saccharimonadales bacterium]|nr:ABC-F family ATP-binding cassette domain-containing protein [Candidatus Saccharimonadales bacterium]